MKAGYKQTEVGVIPEDWHVLRLMDFAEIATGNTPPTSNPENYGDDFLFVSPADLGQVKNIKTTTKRLSCAGFSIARKFPAGSILFVCIGSTIGKCGIASVELTSNQQINAIFPSGHVSTEFVYYQVSAAASRVMALAGEQAVPLVNKSQFAGTKISFPSTKTEQQAIASALSDADELIESLEQLLAKKRNLKQGAMQELLTGKRRLAGFGAPWNRRKLGELLTIRHGKSQHHVESSDGTYPILATGGQIGWAADFLYDKSSVLIGRKGTIDKPQYMNSPFWTVDTLFYSEIADGNSAKFLYYRFCLIDWKQHNEASGVPSLSAKTIENIEILCPESDEQTAIAAILSDMDADITALETQLAKARQIKQGMMQELLTGRIRLV